MSKRFLTNLIGLIATLFLGIAAYAQNPVKITGQVVDSDGAPLTGVVVMPDGNTANAATTGLDGEYSMTIPSVRWRPNRESADRVCMIF